MELNLIQPYPSHLQSPLSNKEKQHYRNLNLCHYCVSLNHHIQTCPLALVHPQQPQHIQATQVLVPSDTLTKDPTQK